MHVNGDPTTRAIRLRFCVTQLTALFISRNASICRKGREKKLPLRHANFSSMLLLKTNTLLASLDSDWCDHRESSNPHVDRNVFSPLKTLSRTDDSSLHAVQRSSHRLSRQFNRGLVKSSPQSKYEGPIGKPLHSLRCPDVLLTSPFRLDINDFVTIDLAAQDNKRQFVCGTSCVPVLKLSFLHYLAKNLDHRVYDNMRAHDLFSSPFLGRHQRKGVAKGEVEAKRTCCAVIAMLAARLGFLSHDFAWTKGKVIPSADPTFDLEMMDL
ncbi:uncharacterized protein BDR25DRAFT_351520 [Lindgomyces ingoldianus]|uniref:Uncharacterized protein n=1 Tax=Lindgomyces ingoldianus TaxID=673940 RepID=A0ACB6R7H2_9PLEO|nr:uncharacterized protein BDR25DRAFT_351520 [Lindgomyces ingoldianus]KAF2475037.1 hypothetical protein BDR25DRAFT_351520 [Lindgomyces ingoldianus]